MLSRKGSSSLRPAAWERDCRVEVGSNVVGHAGKESEKSQVTL